MEKPTQEWVNNTRMMLAQTIKTSIIKAKELYAILEHTQKVQPTKGSLPNKKCCSLMEFFQTGFDPPPPYFRDLWTFSDTFLNSWLKLTEHTTKLLRWWQMHFRRPKETLPYGMIPILPHMATLEIATPMQTATRPSLTTFFCGSPQWIRARFGSNLSPSLICTL